MHPLTLEPLDQINGFSVRPGLYEINGAMVVPGGVNFTITHTELPPASCCFFTAKKQYPTQRSHFPATTASATSIR